MIADFFNWFTHLENTKPFALVLFFVTFVGIIIYVYSNKKRKRRLESYKNIPFEEDDKD
ncbi:hypothetical protein MNBD_GAMMA23-1745 [hydrothermal vent metagenome]|uniref:Cytochrome c oxidase subunit CcoQ n=1 Tax=hydrothermal vent metagenome TaxID=652676 RepID=A0A3B1ADG5_9ZZZZ